MDESIKESVSVIFICKDEIFLIKRNKALRSFPGYISFIGGRVDKNDHNSEDYLLSALKREIKEETAIGFCPKNVEFRYLGEVSSPDYNPIRFRNHFYYIDLQEKPVFTLDPVEIEWGAWVRPKSFLEEWARGIHLLIPPIKYFIEMFATEKLADSKFQRESKDDKIPVLETISDLIQIMPLSNTLPPAKRTNAFLIKGERPLLIDPAPKDLAQLELLIPLISDAQKIMITHYHYDHYEHLDLLARRLQLPVIMSGETKELIEKHRKDTYFKDIQVQLIKDGDTVAFWKGKQVQVVSTPGHASGQLSLLPTCRSWMIVGDIFQGIGSVVVGGENSSMTEYMQSLRHIIELAPQCVIPSHGIPLGGVGIIEKNLRHRLQREQQIFELFSKYNDIERVYELVYPHLDPALKKYAMANIQSHHQKLVREGKLDRQIESK